MTILTHTVFGAKDSSAPTVFLLHGILGSRRNWASSARRIVARYPHWRCVSIDLRGHGDSHGQPGPHTVQRCARDLIDLADHLGFYPQCVIGHSFGGKVALSYAQMHPPALETLWSLDSDPGLTTAETISGVADVIDGIYSAPVPVPHRLAVRNHFDSQGFAPGIGAWMTTNLRRSAEGYVWALDMPVIESMLNDYRQLDVWSVIEDANRGIDVHCLLAGQSTWWQGAVQERLESAQRVGLHILPEAGHWVHIDDPEGMLNAFTVTFDSRP